MASVTHVINRQRIEGAAENPHFLLTNERGDYLALGNPNHSNYDGLFLHDGGYFKILSNISPAQQTEDLIIAQNVMRKSRNASQEFHLFEQGLLAQCSGEFILTLDCKKLYDESDRGRIYEVDYVPPLRSGGGNALSNISIVKVHYVKYSDDSKTEMLYEKYVCIATTMHVDLVKIWRQAYYPYDARRGTQNTPWVYDLLRLTNIGKVTISASSSAAHAQQQAVDLLIKHTLVHDAPALPTMQQIAWRSLNALHTKNGIMAGLPWFFQHWSRDELISCGGLLAAKEYGAVQRILEKWYAAIKHDGTLPAIYPDQGLNSSDAPGWLGKRTRDLLVKLSDEGMLYQLPQTMLAEWREKTGLLLDAAPLHGDLVWSDPNTTWMDTSYNDDGRKGYRIEIQALYLALYDAHAYLCTITKTPVQHERSERAQRLHAAVQKFASAGTLHDGINADKTLDRTLRPNMFLAWYVAPKLFTNEEWSSYFSSALEGLWLPWGGLATIGKQHPNFHGSYTGEAVDSYHRGDSWYYVNNIAAMALRSTDAERFRPYIQSITDASIRDMLWQGYCGHCSELSSANAQEACGTHSQAWSASTLLELLQ